MRPQDALLGCVEGSSTLHDVGDDEAAKTLPGLVVYRFYGPLIFANIRYFIERIEWFIAEERDPVRMVLLDRAMVYARPVTADLSAGEDGVSLFYDIMVGGGVTF